MSRPLFTYCPYCATPLEARTLERRLRPTCPVCGYVYFADPKACSVPGTYSAPFKRQTA